jgi:hypothetical protein
VARPTHRLELLLVPGADVSIGAADALVSRLFEEGVITASGEAASNAFRWIDGGFERVVIDRPGRETLYANRTGGFRVRCPTLDTSIVPAFNRAVTAWRVGGARSLSCPACGDDHDLVTLGYQPPATFGPWAVVSTGAASAQLSPDGARWATDALGDYRFVWRR